MWITSWRREKKPGPRGPGFLFADAEVRKDVAEDVVGMDGSGDFAEVMKRLARIHGNEVAGNAVAQSVTHRLKCGFGGGERFEVSQVGDHELETLVVNAMTIEQGLA